MKPWQLNRRVNGLSERLKDLPSECIRIDFDSFPEPEKVLLRKVFAIDYEHGALPPVDVLNANKELIGKAFEVIARRVVDLFVEVLPTTSCCDEVERWFFKLHFCNFLADWGDCLQHVREWSEKDREEFLNDMKQNDMMDKVFRIPRGFNEHDTPAEGDKRGEGSK